MKEENKKMNKIKTKKESFIRKPIFAFDFL